MQNKRNFASPFFELLRASLRLNTQRRSASSMCAFKKEERNVLISVTLMTGIAGYKTVPTIDITFCMYVKGPTRDLKERFVSLIVCLFIYCFFFCHPHFLIFSSYFFCYPHFCFHPYFSIRIFPSASAIRRYPVRVLQTPITRLQLL